MQYHHPQLLNQHALYPSEPPTSRHSKHHFQSSPSASNPYSYGHGALSSQRQPTPTSFQLAISTNNGLMSDPSANVPPPCDYPAGPSVNGSGRAAHVPVGLLPNSAGHRQPMCRSSSHGVNLPPCNGFPSSAMIDVGSVRRSAFDATLPQGLAGVSSLGVPYIGLPHLEPLPPHTLYHRSL